MKRVFNTTRTSSGYIEITPKPDDSELEEYYSSKYYQQGLGSYETSYTKEELQYFQNRLERYYHILMPHLVSLDGKSFLDIGAGEGFTTAFFARRGLIPESIDYSCAGIEANNPEVLSSHNVGNIYNLLNEKIAHNKTYDLIILQNVLEHVIDPDALLRNMRSLLAADGVALITIPNDFSITQEELLARNLISRKYWVSPPDHLNYFNSNTIKAYLDDQGWDLLDVISDFPVDFFLFEERTNYVEDPSCGKSVHHARLMIENMLHRQPIDAVVSFYRAASELGIGRYLTLVVHPR